MKISVICIVGSLLVSVGASATGIVPVFDLDFTRSATEALKKRGIGDGCIISAATPEAFTFCREGSTTLWKYQAVDGGQRVTIQEGETLPSMDHGQITLVEIDSLACKQEARAPIYKSAIPRPLPLGLIVLFLLVGLRYTFQAIMHLSYCREAVSGFFLQRVEEPTTSHNYLSKALGAFGIAAALAFVYFRYFGF
ncbi:MAG: hypothetical protein ACOH2R_12225 [Pseudomonas sp.]